MIACHAAAATVAGRIDGAHNNQRYSRNRPVAKGIGLWEPPSTGIGN